MLGRAPVRLEILRQQLREKFPDAHGMRDGAELSNAPTRRLHPDEFPVGRISELVPLREANPDRKILRATDLQCLPHGIPVTVAGMAICRQRPGTAKGHCFISLEDETGISNLFVKKETFHHHRLIVTAEAFLLAHGRLQRSEDDQPTVYVTSIVPLPRADRGQAAVSHDFH